MTIQVSVTPLPAYDQEAKQPADGHWVQTASVQSNFNIDTLGQVEVIATKSEKVGAGSMEQLKNIVALCEDPKYVVPRELAANMAKRLLSHASDNNIVSLDDYSAAIMSLASVLEVYMIGSAIHEALRADFCKKVEGLLAAYGKEIKENPTFAAPLTHLDPAWRRLLSVHGASTLREKAISRGLLELLGHFHQRLHQNHLHTITTMFPVWYGIRKSLGMSTYCTTYNLNKSWPSNDCLVLAVPGMYRIQGDHKGYADISFGLFSQLHSILHKCLNKAARKLHRPLPASIDVDNVLYELLATIGGDAIGHDVTGPMQVLLNSLPVYHWSDVKAIGLAFCKMAVRLKGANWIHVEKVAQSVFNYLQTKADGQPLNYYNEFELPLRHSCAAYAKHLERKEAMNSITDNKEQPTNIGGAIVDSNLVNLVNADFEDAPEPPLSQELQDAFTNALKYRNQPTDAPSADKLAAEGAEKHCTEVAGARVQIEVADQLAKQHLNDEAAAMEADEVLRNYEEITHECKLQKVVMSRPMEALLREARDTFDSFAAGTCTEPELWETLTALWEKHITATPFTPSVFEELIDDHRPKTMPPTDASQPAPAYEHSTYKPIDTSKRAIYALEDHNGNILALIGDSDLANAIGRRVLAPGKYNVALMEDVEILATEDPERALNTLGPVVDNLRSAAGKIVDSEIQADQEARDADHSTPDAMEQYKQTARKIRDLDAGIVDVMKSVLEVGEKSGCLQNMVPPPVVDSPHAPEDYRAVPLAQPAPTGAIKCSTSYDAEEADDFMELLNLDFEKADPYHYTTLMALAARQMALVIRAAGGDLQNDKLLQLQASMSLDQMMSYGARLRMNSPTETRDLLATVLRDRDRLVHLVQTYFSKAASLKDEKKRAVAKDRLQQVAEKANARNK